MGSFLGRQDSSLGDQCIRRAVWSRIGKFWLSEQNLLAVCFMLPARDEGLDEIFIFKIVIKSLIVA